MTSLSLQTPIGFIGTGVMGKSMAQHFITAGYPVHLHTRTSSKAKELLEKGGIWEDSIAQLAQKCQIIFTIVGFPQDVRSVYLGQEGLLNHIQKETYLIDMTTSQPTLAIEIHKAALSKKCCALDAPVSGGDLGAREAKLSIMVGGDKQVFDFIKPLFHILGNTVVYQGKAGSGQHCKMCNQIAIASGMIGVCESIAYAFKSGLDPRTVMKSIASGAAGSWSLSHLGPRIIENNFEPGFFVKHFIKDMIIALESAKEMNLNTPGLELVLVRYRELAEQGFENNGTQALYKLYN